MFVAFILLCGVTHFMMIWTLWNPDYGIEALIKAATAIVSLVTAVALWPLLPKAIALPSTATLQAHIAERDTALADLRAAMHTMVEMREHEARQKLLLDELNHRVKNTLAVVQSMAAQTFRSTPDLLAARDAFTERLMALSATHNILVDRAWEGAELHALLTTSLKPYGRPFSYAGVDLALDANLAVSLGMAIHELATNALKHGAWRGEGSVAVEVSEVDDSQVQIVWREYGGPAVSAPQRRGFGMRLLNTGVAGEFNGRVTLDFAPTGLVCTICVPCSHQLRVIPMEPT